MIEVKHIKTNKSYQKLFRIDNIVLLFLTILSITLVCGCATDASAGRIENLFETVDEIQATKKIVTPRHKPTVPVEFTQRRFKKVASFVIITLEGDSKIVDEPNGGIAKYGINSIANPDVNVRNLTRTQAYQIAHNKYWKPIGADKLSGGMQLVAFDTAFNHGIGAARKLIRKAGNNPHTLLNLRQKEYDRLVRSNPRKYKRFQAGWTNRLDRMRKFL